MTSLNTLVGQLQAERARLSAQLANINAALAALKMRGAAHRKRRLSAAAIARIRAAQKKRWADWRRRKR
jgi:hypothetical protein